MYLVRVLEILPWVEQVCRMIIFRVWCYLSYQLWSGYCLLSSSMFKFDYLSDTFIIDGKKIRSFYV
jgi:hypothetical protein